jgi:hypothetical protein
VKLVYDLSERRFRVERESGGALFESDDVVEVVKWVCDRITNDKTGDGNSVVFEKMIQPVTERVTAPRLIMDGVKEVNPDEIQSFIRQTIKARGSSSLGISIPREITRALKLEPVEKLLVAIKRPSESEIEEWKVYNYV